MTRPSVELAVAINRSIRENEKWFDEPDDLDRVQRALEAAPGVDDPVELAAIVAYRVTRAQGFVEGNKRTALLLAKWTLDRNGIDGGKVIPPDDRQLADLLVKAAAGLDVEADVLELFRARTRA